MQYYIDVYEIQNALDKDEQIEFNRMVNKIQQFRKNEIDKTIVRLDKLRYATARLGRDLNDSDIEWEDILGVKSIK